MRIDLADGTARPAGPARDARSADTARHDAGEKAPVGATLR